MFEMICRRFDYVCLYNGKWKETKKNNHNNQMVNRNGRYHETGTASCIHKQTSFNMYFN